MAPQLKEDFIVLKVIHSPFPIGSPNFTVAHDKIAPTIIRVYAARTWFQDVMSIEKPKVEPGIQVCFSEWSIKSCNTGSFTMGGDRYDEMFVLLGGERVHWLFYSANPYIVLQGSQELELTYCGCCLNLHYLKVIQNIKKCMENF